MRILLDSNLVKDAQDSIRAALENERALDVISREARISGRARSA